MAARVALAVRHRLPAFRAGIEHALSTRFRAESIGEERAWPAWLEAQGERAVIVQLDSRDSWAVLHECASRPNVTVVAIIRYSDAAIYMRAIRAGAAGVAYESDTPHRVVRILEAAIHGDVVMHRELARKVAEETRLRSELTEEELSVLRAVAGGTRAKRVAVEHHMSATTLRRRLESVNRKLGARNVGDAINAARQFGLVD